MLLRSLFAGLLLCPLVFLPCPAERAPCTSYTVKPNDTIFSICSEQVGGLPCPATAWSTFNLPSLHAMSRIF